MLGAQAGETRIRQQWTFHDRVSRCRELLRFMAESVAVRNCFAAASQNPPAFESEAAVQCWLIRILIDEALLIHDSGQDLTAIRPEPVLRNRCYIEDH